MPLCTIFTKCPAPSSPTQSQQGVPSSTLAAIAWKIGFTCGHAAGLPPGIIDGPLRAPSSPPETPVPINRIPFSASAFVRRVESRKQRVAAINNDVALFEVGTMWSII